MASRHCTHSQISREWGNHYPSTEKMRTENADGIHFEALAASFNRRHRLSGGLEIPPEEVENEHFLLRSEFPEATPEKIFKLLIGKIIRLIRGANALKTVDFGGDADIPETADEFANPEKICASAEATAEALDLLENFRHEFPVLTFALRDSSSGKSLEKLSKKLRKRKQTVSRELENELAAFENLKVGILPIRKGLF